MKEQLVRGRWGFNDRISEKSIALELGISRTPVRDAIHKLIAEGLLYQVPSSGTFVTNPDRQGIEEMFEIRLALEVATAEKAVNRLTERQLRELRRQFMIMRHAARVFRTSGQPSMLGDVLERFIKADRSMHDTFLSASGNRLAWKIVHNGRIQTLIFGLHSYRRDLHHVSATLLCHWRLLSAAERRDRVAAREAMESHILNSMRDALAAYDRQPCGSLIGGALTANEDSSAAGAFTTRRHSFA